MMDYDFRRIPRLRNLFAVAHILHLHVAWIRTDRTRRGWHVIVRLRQRLQPAEIIALQAIMGSDYRRETLNLLRAMSPASRNGHGRKVWSVLFSEKYWSMKP